MSLKYNRVHAWFHGVKMHASSSSNVTLTRAPISAGPVAVITPLYICAILNFAATIPALSRAYIWPRKHTFPAWFYRARLRTPVAIQVVAVIAPLLR